MNSEKKFVPVMLTPFQKDGAIDYEALTRLTHFYLNKGAKGLFANCQSSEMFDLSSEERLSLIAHIIKVSEGKVPIVATGNFGDSIAAQATFIKRVYDLGVQAVILLTNQFVKPTEPESVLESNIMKLLDLTEGIPLGFYECPEPYKIIFSPELLSRLVSTGRIIYHKDTCLNIEQVRSKNELCKGESRFGLYDAYMAHAVASLQSGSAGLSCIQGNYFPELVVWLCKNYANPALAQEVSEVQQFFINEMEVMHADYPKSAKYYLWKRGMLMSIHTRRSPDNYISYQTKANMDGLERRYNELMRKFADVIPNIGKIV